VLDLPDPLGPTIAENDWDDISVHWSDCKVELGLTLWKGPMTPRPR
jgi:hypothetical protein